MGANEVKQYTFRKKHFVLSRLEQPKQDKNLFKQYDEPKEPTKEGHLSYVFFPESLFASVSKVNRGHPSLVSLLYTPCSGVIFQIYTARINHVHCKKG
jgi:hypothetical protein